MCGGRWQEDTAGRKFHVWCAAWQGSGDVVVHQVRAHSSRTVHAYMRRSITSDSVSDRSLHRISLPGVKATITHNCRWYKSNRSLPGWR